MNIQELIAKAQKELQTAVHQHEHADESFEQCLKCTACTAVCPVTKVNPFYPGPKQSGPDGERLRLKSADFFDEALKYCLNCKRCEVACPSDVKIGDIIVRARNKHIDRQHKPALHKLRDAILSNTDIMGSLNTPLAPIVNKITGLKATKFLLEKTIGVSQHRQLPKYAFGTFRNWYLKKGKELIDVFNALDIGVVLLEKEKCCGLPLMVNSFPERAKKIAQFNTDYIEKMVDENGLDVIGEASSCTLNLRDEYHHILGIDNVKVRPHIHMVTPYLFKLFEQGKKLPLKPLKLRVAYHTACHVEKAGWAPYTLEVLKQIPGLEVVMLPSQCCGIAGTYGFKAENYESSQAIGKTLFENINSGGFDYVVSECQTCKWQIDMSSNVTCIHPITLLAMALER